MNDPLAQAPTPPLPTGPSSDLPEGLSFPLLAGVTDMPAHEFYHALTPELAPADYDLPALWEPVVQKYPPICPQLKLVGKPGTRSYVIHDVPVVASEALVGPGGPATARERWTRVRDITRVDSPEELATLTCYKVKPLLADGSFGARTLLHPDNARTCEDMAGRLTIDREFEKFIYYVYACFIEAHDEEGVDSYEAFRDFYGDRIYAIEVEREGAPQGVEEPAGNDRDGAEAADRSGATADPNATEGSPSESARPTVAAGQGAALGLLWPDWICHEPDAHLEIGLLYRGAGARYAGFSGFAAGERCVIRVPAPS